MKFTKKRLALLVFLTLTASVFLVSRLVFDMMQNLVFMAQLRKNMALHNGTEAYKNWVTPPAPVAFRIYVFDIVNPKEVLDGTEVPAVIEKGPYVYSMHLSKSDIKFHDNDTVQFRQPEAFFYDEEASAGPASETFTTINMPFFTAASQMQSLPPTVQAVVDAFFRGNGESPFITKSLEEMWWGYEDPVLEEAVEVMKALHINSSLTSGKFGFYMNRNNTDGGLYNIYSGLNGDISNYEVIDRWNGLRKMSVWNSDYANRIEGTDGSCMPPPVKKHANYSIFDGMMFRSLNLVYDKAFTFKGIDALRYVIPFSDFANAKDNPNNAGFCTPDVNHCLPSGAINLSVTSHSAPIALSMPHFVGGDPYYQRQVKGLNPSPEKHQPFYVYHPITGVSLAVGRRYQINLHVKSLPGFEAFRNMPDAYIPVLWIDGYATVDQHTIDIFKHQIQDKLDSMVYVKAAFVGACCLTLLTIVGLLLYWRSKDKKEQEKTRDLEDSEPLIKESLAQNPAVPSPSDVNTRSDDVEPLTP